MFNFANPLYFLFLLLLPFFYLYKRRKKETLLSVSSLEATKSIPNSFKVKTLFIPSFLKYLAFILIVFALARLQYGTKHSNITTEGINIILAVDVSGSMEALDFKKDGKNIDRLTAAIEVIKDFLKKRKYDRIGMVVFGSYAFTQVPLTRDYNTMLFMLERVKVGLAGEKTAIGDAIGVSLKRLKDIKSKSNIIILLTDGRSNSGEISPTAAANLAKDLNVKIYTIGIGSEGDVPFLINDPIFGKRYVYQRADIDEATLEQIAEKTKGLYFRAKDTKSLKKIYSTIDSLEKSKVKIKSFMSYKEYYHYFLFFALLALVLRIVLLNTIYLKI